VIWLRMTSLASFSYLLAFRQGLDAEELGLGFNNVDRNRRRQVGATGRFSPAS